jgi:hypothetical protein
MSRLKNFVAIAAVSLSWFVGGSLCVAEPETLAERKANCQKGLDELKNLPDKLLTNPFQCILPHLVKTDCTVHIIYGEGKDREQPLTFKFMRGDKEIVSLPGHRGSVFGFWKNKLYFVNYGLGGPGASVEAYDLADGKQLWATKLIAAEAGDFSSYGNRLGMIMSRMDPPNNTMFIEGHESQGSYLEVLNLETGEMLAHRVFHNGIPGREKFKVWELPSE